MVMLTMMMVMMLHYSGIAAGKISFLASATLASCGNFVLGGGGVCVLVTVCLCS